MHPPQCAFSPPLPFNRPSSTPSSLTLYSLPATTGNPGSFNPEASTHKPTAIATKPLPHPPTTARVIPKVIDLTPTNTSSKGSKPYPVAYPPPSTHSLEQRPTRTLCIFCCWQRSQDQSGHLKVKSVNLGCRECNLTLCRECFSLFHVTSCRHS